MKIVFNQSTKTFSIQGQTGMQLRRLKEFIEGIKDPLSDEYPQLPTFFDRIKSFPVKSDVEMKLNSALNTSGLHIDPYLVCLTYTRQYDIDHGTHNLDDGYLIIMHEERDNVHQGAAINFKDRKGKRLFIFSQRIGTPLTKKSFREITNMKFFSKKSNEDPNDRLQGLIDDKEKDFEPMEYRPPQIRKPIFKKLVLDNSNGEYNFIYDLFKDEKPTYKGFTMDFYNFNKLYYVGIDFDDSNIIIYK